MEKTKCPRCGDVEAVVLVETGPNLWECFACDNVFTGKDIPPVVAAASEVGDGR